MFERDPHHYKIGNQNNSAVGNVSYEQGIPLALQELIKVLKKCYVTQSSLTLLMDEEKTIGIGDIYVDLELIETIKNDSKDNTNIAYNNINEERREFLLDPIEQEKRKPIALEDLFKIEPQNSSNASNTVSRVFLQGAAGMGKTTLCRHLIYRWASGTLWQEQFTVVIYLPLREIILNYNNNNNNATYSLEEIILGNWENSALIQRDIFGKQLVTASHKVALWNFIQQQPQKALFILDGFDEVQSSHPAVQALLNYAPYYLLTSRPLAVPTQIQRKVENIGFSKENRHRYIKLYFELIQQSEQAELLLQWLEHNPSLLGLSSIAINCQLICAAWQNRYERNNAMPSHLTMTQLYDLIMLQWQKRAVKKNGQIGIEEWCYLQDKDIQELCFERMQILGELAFKGLSQLEGVIVSGEWLEEVVINALKRRGEEINPQNKIKLTRELLDLGILKAQGLSKNPYQDNYEYAHLTFMEWLTANYLALGFAEPEKTEARQRSIDALLKYQYHPKFEVVWWFIAGRLSADKSQGLKAYFLQLLSGPQDMHGLRQVTQLLHCSEESYRSLSKEFRSILFDLFVTWLKLSKRTLSFIFFLQHLAKCTQIIKSDAVQGGFKEIIENGNRDKQVLRILIPLLSAENKELLTRSLLLELDGEAKYEGRYVLEALGVWLELLMGKWRDALLEAIKERLFDAYKGVREAAADTLLIWVSYLTDQELSIFLNDVLQRLANEDLGFHDYALEVVLPSISEELLANKLSDKNVHKLVINSDWEIRLPALKVISRCLGRLTDLQCKVLLEMAKQWLEHESVIAREAAFELLAHWPMGLVDQQRDSFFEVIQHGLLDEEWSVRRAALRLLKSSTIHFLERRGDFLEMIYQRLIDAEEHVRNIALESLLYWPEDLTTQQYDSFFVLISEWLLHQDWWVRAGALNVLAVWSTRLTDQQFNTLPETILQCLIDQNGSFHGSVRGAAVKMLKTWLEHLSDQRCSVLSEWIKQWLTNKNPLARQGVLEVLASRPTLIINYEYEAFLELIQQCLVNEDSSIRQATLWVMQNWSAQLNNSQRDIFLELIQQRLADEDGWVRRAALKVLSNWPERLMEDKCETILKILQHLLVDQDWWVRSSALNVLAVWSTRLTQLQRDTFLKFIPQSLADKDSEVRTYALKLIATWSALFTDHHRTILLELVLKQLANIGNHFDKVVFDIAIHWLHSSQSMNILKKIIYELVLQSNNILYELFIPYELRNKLVERITIAASSSTTLQAWIDQNIILIKADTSYISQLKKNFVQLRTHGEEDTHANLLYQLRRKLQQEIPRVSQMHMTHFGGNALRNYISGFAIIDENHWAVSLLRGKNKEHTFILLEGIENNKEIIYEIHLRAIDYKLVIGIETVKIEKLQSYKNYYYKGWQIRKEQAQQLLEDVRRDQSKAIRGEIKYNLLGNGAIHQIRFNGGNSYHNCLSWIEEKLSNLDLPIQRDWLDVFLVHPHRHVGTNQNEVAHDPQENRCSIS